MISKVKGNLTAIVVTAFLVLAGTLIVSRVVGPSTEPTIIKVSVPTLSAKAAVGKTAYDDNCAGCHGTNGAGSDQGPPLIHDTYNPGHHADEAFYRAVRQGVPRHHWLFGDMPPQPQVAATEVTDIIRYVRELQQANGIFYRPHRM